MVNPVDDPLLGLLQKLARDARNRVAGAVEKRVWEKAAWELGVLLTSGRAPRNLQLEGRLLGHDFHARNAPSPRRRTAEERKQGLPIPLDRVRFTVDFRGPEGLALRTIGRRRSSRVARARFDLPPPGEPPPPEFRGYLTPKRLAALHDLADLVRTIDARRIHAELEPAPTRTRTLVRAATRLAALARTLELRPGDPPAVG